MGITNKNPPYFISPLHAIVSLKNPNIHNAQQLEILRPRKATYFRLCCKPLTHLRRFCALLITLFVSIAITSTTIFASSVHPVFTIDGNKLHVSIEIDTVAALAGLKLSLTFDSKELVFVSAEKTKATASLMHVVNDKNPGKIIIVMAGAKGISGKSLPIIDLTFSISSNSEPSKSIQISDVQLMDENLKDINTSIMTNDVDLKATSNKTSAGKY